MLKSRTLIGILCIVLAMLVSFGIAPLVNKVAAEKVYIVRMVADVPQGIRVFEENMVWVKNSINWSGKRISTKPK